MSTVVCFQCGQAVGHPPTLNQLKDGSTCSTCAERVLDDQPPIFHMPFGLLEGGDAAEHVTRESLIVDDHPPEPA